jgi:cyclase
MFSLDHLRILEPHSGILAFYDGRIPGQRFMAEPNWVDEGALSLGIASYAIVSGAQALVYDTHVSVAHGLAIRAELTRRGVTDITVVLSHWHKDHVAGTAAFVGCKVIANSKTAAHLALHRPEIEAGTRPPPIKPLILPDTLFEGAMQLTIGDQDVHLIEANIHSDDATVLWLPETGLLFAGDTAEDCCTYVAEPQDLGLHLTELDRLRNLQPRWVLPNHGSPDRIAKGGYVATILTATQSYIRWLLQARHDQSLAQLSLQTVIAADLAAGTLDWFAPYEGVHDSNLAAMMRLDKVG